MRFVENNKNIPEGSKEMLLGIYGIGSRTKYFYNKDTKNFNLLSPDTNIYYIRSNALNI